jgi:hypothetical protein
MYLLVDMPGCHRVYLFLREFGYNMLEYGTLCMLLDCKWIYHGGDKQKPARIHGYMSSSQTTDNRKQNRHQQDKETQSKLVIGMFNCDSFDGYPAAVAKNIAKLGARRP